MVPRSSLASTEPPSVCRKFTPPLVMVPVVPVAAVVFVVVVLVVVEPAVEEAVVLPGCTGLASHAMASASVMGVK